MGHQNNTVVTVSRFKPVQCIACRFLMVTLCVACRSSFVMSVVWQVKFREKCFKISFMQSLLFNWFLKFCQCLFLYIQCDKFTKLVTYYKAHCCGDRRAVKKKKKKKTCMFVFKLYLQFLLHQHQCTKLMFPNISPFSVSHSENTPRYMHLKDAPARCCLHSLWLTQSKVITSWWYNHTLKIEGLCVVQHNHSITKTLNRSIQRTTAGNFGWVDALRKQT